MTLAQCAPEPDHLKDKRLFPTGQTSPDELKAFSYQWLKYPMIAALIAATYLALPLGSGVLKLELGDPDNYLRLAEVRDWMGGQSWWDITQYRIDPPDGVVLHWSRLADLPLAALIGFLSLFMPLAQAETWAAALLPPFVLTLTLFFAARSAGAVGGKISANIALFFVVMGPLLLVQFLPGRIDHHGLQLMLLAAAICAALSPDAVRGAAFSGVALAASLVIGLEFAVHAAIIALWFALRWLVRGSDAAPQARGFVAALALGVTTLIVISVPAQDWLRATYDQIGRGHLAIIGALAAAFLVLQPLGNGSLLRRMGIAIACVLIGVGMLALFPEVLSQPYQEIAPELRDIWIANLAETRSFTAIVASDPASAAAYFIPPSISVIAALWLVRRRKGDDRVLLLASLAAISTLLSAWQIRANASAFLICAIIAGIVLGDLWQHRERVKGGLAFVALAALALNGTIIGAAAQMIVPSPPVGAAILANGASCVDRARSFAAADQPTGLVLTSIDRAALILVMSDHAVLSASNHRAIAGNTKSYAIWMAQPDEARRQMVEAGIDYVFQCGERELLNIAQNHPDSLASAMTQNEVPEWLETIPGGAGSTQLAGGAGAYRLVQ